MATVDDYTFAPPPGYPGADKIHLGREAGAELRPLAEPAPAQVLLPDPDEGRLFTEAAR